MMIYSEYWMDTYSEMASLFLKGSKAFMSIGSKVQKEVFEQPVKPPFMVTIQRVLQSRYYVNGDTVNEAVENAMRRFSIEPNKGLTQVGLTTKVYVKNDSDGYDVITGLQEK